MAIWILKVLQQLWYSDTWDDDSGVRRAKMPVAANPFLRQSGTQVGRMQGPDSSRTILGSIRSECSYSTTTKRKVKRNLLSLSRTRPRSKSMPEDISVKEAVIRTEKRVELCEVNEPKNFILQR
ncbi:hypothetical protein ACLKA6_003078, partial [Drosophila palustris]